MISNSMAAVKYKMKSYKGCPGITIMGFAMDMVIYMIGLGCVGSVFNSFQQGKAVKGLIWAAVAVVFFILSTKLTMKYEYWGRTKETEVGNREAEQLRDATKETLEKYAKQKKKEDVLVIAGMVLTILVVFPAGAALWIFAALNFG